MRGEKGFALVVTLVITTLMVALLVELVQQVTVDVAISRGFRDGQQASLLAESGITGGTKLLQLSLQGQDYSSLSDSWAKPVVIDDESGSLEISVSEESGLICINDLVQPNGDPEPFILAVLNRLGKRLSIAEEGWSCLADWIDTNDTPRTNGAEKAYYQTQNPPYVPHNGRLSTFSELSLVRGIGSQGAASLRPFVTIFSGQSGAPRSLININTAPREVLMALDEGIDERMAERILEERRLKAFRAPGELSRIPGGDAVSQRLAGRVGVKGNLFRITAIARVKDTARTVEAVVRISGGASDLVSWQEY